jgi:hypothetical protein
LWWHKKARGCERPLPVENRPKAANGRKNAAESRKSVQEGGKPKRPARTLASGGGSASPADKAVVTFSVIELAPPK